MSQLFPRGRHAKRTHFLPRGVMHALVVLACVPLLLDGMHR